MVKKALMGVCGVLVLAVVLPAAMKRHADAHFFDGYDPAVPLKAEEGEMRSVEEVGESFGVECPRSYRLSKVYFEARPGERVPTLLTFPKESEGRLPAIVLLHGSHQEKEMIEEVCTPFNAAGFVVACFDQHMRGERKLKGGALATALAFRERTWKTVHDARRLIDYLVTRPDIDPDRIYLVGASYGAVTGTSVLAQEPRIKAAVLIVGGGNLRLLGRAPDVLRELPSWIHPFAGPLVAFTIGAADPVRTAPHTAGRPKLMQNGSNDGVVIPESGQALFDALAEPKEIRWYPVDHPDREENGQEVIRMLNEALTWLSEQDARVTAQAA